jgi:hypothetical protein
LDIFLTIFAGVGTFVLGQIALKLLIDPVQSFKMTIAEVSNKLILYANIYANPRPPGDEKQKEMSEYMRNLSSKLESNMYLIPAYCITRKVFGLPSKEQVIIASKSLIAIHNGHDGILANQGILNCYAAQDARIALGIHIPKDEYLNPEYKAHFIKAKSE